MPKNPSRKGKKPVKKETGPFVGFDVRVEKTEYYELEDK